MGQRLGQRVRALREEAAASTFSSPPLPPGVGGTVEWISAAAAVLSVGVAILMAILNRRLSFLDRTHLGYARQRNFKRGIERAAGQDEGVTRRGHANAA